MKTAHNIFVTVGTASFDPLIEALDEQVARGLVQDRIVAQIGDGLYEPEGFRFFRYSSEEVIQKGLDWADIVINTGGAATIHDTIIKRKKRMIVVWMRPWSPQAVKPFVDGKHVMYCEVLGFLYIYIHESKSFEFLPFKPEKFELQPILDQLDIEPNRLHPVERGCFVISLSCILMLIIAFIVMMLGVE